MNHTDTKGQIYNSSSGVKKKNHIIFKTCTNDWIKNFKSGLGKLKICLKHNCSLQQHLQFLYQRVLAHCGSLFIVYYMLPFRNTSLFFFFLSFPNLCPFLVTFQLPTYTTPMLDLLHSKTCEWQQAWQPLGWWKIWREQASPACSSG